MYSGKDAFVRAGGSYAGGDRPGLSVTCAKFIRDHDVSLLGWDMMDARPDPYGLTFPVHGRALQLRRRAPRQRLTRANR